MSFTPDRVFVIGVGGTGGYLASPLTRMIYHHPLTQNSQIVFIDGDDFEERNQTRQIVGPNQVGQNKAEAMVDFCNYQGLEDTTFVSDFIYMATFIPMIRTSECPLIICSVDNNATRVDVINAILKVCDKKDFLFITPGNSDGLEKVTGQVLWFGRVDGVSVGLNPTLAYANLQNPSDAIPHKGSCALNTPSRPQLISANFMAAALTLAVIQNILDGLANPQHSSLFFNLRTLTFCAS